MATETIFTQKYPAHGYEVRTEVIDHPDKSLPQKTTRKAYTYPGGTHIGNFKHGKLICETMKIKPELASPEMTTCTIGFCEHEQKWYGWHHGLIAGFGIGAQATHLINAPTHKSPPEDTPSKELPYRKRPLNQNTAKNIVKKAEIITTAKTLDDAKNMAICFSETKS